jgi:hypothetical protein
MLTKQHGSIPKRNTDKKIPQNLPLHSTQFATLEIENRKTQNVTQAVAFFISANGVPISRKDVGEATG